MNVIIGCLLIITIIALYFPFAYIRWGNKILNVLERIENNTRKA